MSLITLEEVLATGRGTERSFSCPKHGDTNPSASVNVLKGVWYCYVCKAHDTLEDHVPTIDEVVAILAGDKPPRVYPEGWLDIFDADHASAYWVRRYGMDVASANRCGTDPETGAPTYPLRDDQGRVLGVVTRHEETQPKYRYPWNTSTSRTLYGALRPAEVVVLVEGAGDVMAIEAAGLPPGWTVAGCFGAGLHFPQAGIVARLQPKVVVSAFDDDEAGKRANTSCPDQLLEIAPAVSVSWSRFGGKDAGEVETSARITALTSALIEGGYGRYTEAA